MAGIWRDSCCPCQRVQPSPGGADTAFLPSFLPQPWVQLSCSLPFPSPLLRHEHPRRDKMQLCLLPVLPGSHAAPAPASGLGDTTPCRQHRWSPQNHPDIETLSPCPSCVMGIIWQPHKDLSLAMLEMSPLTLWAADRKGSGQGGPCLGSVSGQKVN